MPSLPVRRPFVVSLAASLLVTVLALSVLPVLRVAAEGPVHVKARDVVTSVAHTRIVPLPITASHVAVHWTGSPDANVTIAFGNTPRAMGEDLDVGRDEESLPGDPETYSSVLWTGGVRFARLTSDRPLAHVTVVAIDAGTEGSVVDAVAGALGGGAVADAAVPQPTIISRAGWGADESLRFDSSGAERWAPSFEPIQVLFIHHTAGRNNDPNPAATVRAIYYFHAVTRGWGDIGYNFLVDQQGRIYEGRHSRDYAPGEMPTGEDLAGNGVRPAQATGYNEGTMAVAMMGTYMKVLPPAAQLNSVERLLAWKADRHGLDPTGTVDYVNPANGNHKVLNVISGHRDVQATACPGDAFYPTLPSVRKAVAARIAATVGPSDTTAPKATLSPMATNPSGATSIPFGLVFSEPVTGLEASDFALSGSSPGWSIDSVAGTASTFTVTVSNSSPTPGTVTLTLADGSVTDLSGNAGPVSAAAATAHWKADDTAPGVAIFATPSKTPTTATAFDFTATFSEPVSGFDASKIVLGGTSESATPWNLYPVLGSGASYNFSIDAAAPADGSLTIAIPAGAVTDLAGNPSEASNVLTIVVDRTAPQTTAPSTALRSKVGFGSLLPSRISWSSSDATSGVVSWDLAKSINGGSFKMQSTGLTDPSKSVSLSPGKSYRFEVRARDAAGNVGPWHAGPTLHPQLVQQSSSAIHYHGTYHTAYSSKYSGGSARYLATAGASATYTVTARSIGFATSRGPTRGVVKVYVDGSLAATIDLYAAKYSFRYVAFSKTWSSSGTHTIRVVAEGTTGRPRIDVDAFLVLR
jgi:N-acetylmuramoyl-L-alanine amidase/Bacterial Ig-like domain